MTDHVPGGTPFTGARMAWVMGGFFAVILAANLSMSWVAVTSFRGVVVQSGYVASQDFNADARALAVQAARGWQVGVAAPGGVVRLALDAPEGPLTGLAVQVVARAAGDARRDRTLGLVEDAPGSYGATEALAPGRYHLSIVADGQGPRYAVTRDLFVAP